MLGWLLVAIAVPAQPARDICATAGACRHIGKVHVETADGKSADLPVDQDLPWVVQDNLLLVPGDWIIVRLINRDGALVPQLVKAGNGGKAPEPGDGEIRFVVHPFDKGNLMMEALSRRPETLDYAALAVVGIDKPQRTSVCSLQPGIPVFESWQWPIRQFALLSFRPTTEPGCKTVEFKKDAANK
jgi:hypothetical protein